MTTTNITRDHFGQCVGCGADQYQGCGTVTNCPLLGGGIDPATVLRAAAWRLPMLPLDRGADVSAAIAYVAESFSGKNGQPKRTTRDQHPLTD